MENTEISWADNTFNPWIGCTKVGPGCDFCYAEAFNNRFHGGNWGPGAPRRKTSPANWKKPLKWNKKAAEKGVRYRVFCASLADVFDNEVPDLWRYDLFKLIIDTPNLDWLVLTKRIGNAAKMLPEIATRFDAMLDSNDRYKPLPNLWLGATIVNQAEADRDIPKLLDVPARTRFLSMEPLLGGIELRKYLSCEDCDPCLGGRADQCAVGSYYVFPEIDWVIVGGESGAKARPMHPDWARSLRDQCVEAGVPYHFKQWGNWEPRAGTSWDEWIMVDGSRHSGSFDTRQHLSSVLPEDSCGIENVGKKAAGRLLDGRTWDEFPKGSN